MDKIYFTINNIGFNVQKSKLIKYSGLFKKLLSENSYDRFCFCIPCNLKEQEIHSIDDGAAQLFDLITHVPDNDSLAENKNEFIESNKSTQLSLESCCSLYKSSQYFMVDKVKRYAMKCMADYFVNHLFTKQQNSKLSDDTIQILTPCIAADPFYLITYMPMIACGFDLNHSYLLFKNIKLVNKKNGPILGPVNRSCFEYLISENTMAHYYLTQLCDSFENIVGSDNSSGPCSGKMQRPKGVFRHLHCIPSHGIHFFYEKDGENIYDKQNPNAVTFGAVNTPENLYTKLNKNERYNIYFNVKAYMNTFEYGIQMEIIQIDDAMTMFVH